MLKTYWFYSVLHWFFRWMDIFLLFSSMISIFLFFFRSLFFKKKRYLFSKARITGNFMVVELKMGSLRRIKASYSLLWTNNCCGACWAAGTLVARALHRFSESPLPPFSPIQSSTSIRRCVPSHLLIMQWHRFTSSSNPLVNETQIKFFYLK